MERRNFLAMGGLGMLAGNAAAASATVRGKRRKLTLVTSWPAGFPGLGDSAARVARRIEAATNGELVITMRPAGELVGAFEVFAAVEAGDADMYHSAAYYQQEQYPAFNFFTALPFGMTADEMAGWLLYGGGQALWDELSATRNVKPFMCTSTGAQMGGWSNRELRTLDDFKGLKIRMPGLGGEALRLLGATPVNVPGGEIHAALKSGDLDAAEWVGPWNDLAAGLPEVAKHYYYPGFQEPGGTLALGINLDIWNSFTPLQQEIIREVTLAEYTRSLAEFNVRNAAALIELKQKYRIVPTGLADDVLVAIGRMSGKVVADLAKTDDMCARAHASFMAARAGALRWGAIGEESYSAARRLEFAY